MSKSIPHAPEVVSKKLAAQKIVTVAEEIHEDIVKKHRKPEMVFPIRSLQNVKYDVKRGHFEILGKTATRSLSYNTVKTFAQSMRLLATTKTTCSTRTTSPENVRSITTARAGASAASTRSRNPTPCSTISRRCSRSTASSSAISPKSAAAT